MINPTGIAFKDGFYNFESFPFLADIVTDIDSLKNGKPLVIVGSRQIGISTALTVMAKMLKGVMSGEIIIASPIESMARNSNDDTKSHFPYDDMPNRRPISALLHKDGKGISYLERENISALIFDSVDCIAEQYVSEAITSSGAEIVVMAGNPDRKSFLRSKWDSSDRREWKINCQCGCHNILNRKVIGPRYIVCGSCGKELTGKGYWCITGSPNSEYRGYRANELGVPKGTSEYLYTCNVAESLEAHDGDQFGYNMLAMWPDEK